MTTPPGGRDTSGDAQAIPQRRRPRPAQNPRPGASPAEPTRVIPSRTSDPFHGWHEEHEVHEREQWTRPISTSDQRPQAYADRTAPLPVAEPAPRRVSPAPRPQRVAADPYAEDPYAAPAGPPPRGPRMPPAPRPGRRRHPVRRAVSLLVLVALMWTIGTAWALRSTWSAVGRVASTPAGGHIADTAGSNYLMVGSDGRTDLSPAERKRLGTGWAEGARTDSIMLLHTGTGEPTLLSIPRDSYVEIPGHGMNKINAAFAIGGPPLLSATVEKATGLRIDGYVEIGFGGFAKVVDSVGGVRMCLPNAINDEKAHINLPAGCQVLDGKNALGYVRMRYSDPEGDLGRVKRQRAFLGALMGKLATPTNVLLPWKLHSVGTSGASAVTVGKDDGLMSTAGAFRGLRAVAGGSGYSVTVPISNPGLQTPAGEAVEWDATKSAALFAALRDGHDLPADLLPATK
ncbi:LCP family protein [Nostocoides veronense]|uniref:Cell envelope-related transcriptional attenuator domain-containing protein n=1 Tax=Nostocoides veronense TaxID=330836 RepID=A0ABP4XV09_9MICO